MSRSETARDELEALVAEYRHVREAHRGARAGGHTRRHLERRLARVERRFEQLLAERVADDELRRAWLEHLHNQAARPAAPARPLPLAFRGRSAMGSVVELRGRPDGDLDVLVDGVEVERVAAEDDLAQTGPGVVFELGGASFREVYDVSAEALAAFARFVATPAAGLAAEHTRELVDDGLLDRNLGLTPRGRRALGSTGRA